MNRISPLLKVVSVLFIGSLWCGCDATNQILRGMGLPGPLGGIGTPKEGLPVAGTELSVNIVNLYVDDANGSDTNSGGQADPLKTIGKALQKLDDSGALDAGASIYVSPGTYDPFVVSNVPLRNDSTLTIRRWDDGTSDGVWIDGGDPNLELTGITISEAGRVAIENINVMNGSVGIGILKSHVVLDTARIEGSAERAVDAIDSAVVVKGDLSVGQTSPCGDGLAFMGCQVQGELEAPAVWEISVEGDGASALTLYESFAVVGGMDGAWSSLSAATAGDDAGDAISVEMNSSLVLVGSIDIRTGGTADGIDVVHSSSLQIVSPRMSLRGSGAGSTCGIRVENTSTAYLFPWSNTFDPNSPNDPNTWADWQISNYARAGIQSGATSVVNMQYITSGSVTLSGSMFGTGIPEFSSIAGIWVPAGSVFEEWPAAPGIDGRTIIRDYQFGMLAESYSLCMVKRVAMGLPGLNDPNIWPGSRDANEISNNTCGICAWNSFVDIDHLEAVDANTRICEGFSRLGIASGKATVSMIVPMDANFLVPSGHGESPSNSYIMATNEGRVEIRSEGIMFFDSNDSGVTFVTGQNEGQVDIFGALVTKDFQSVFSLDDGSSCKATLGISVRDSSVPNQDESRFAVLDHGSRLELHAISAGILGYDKAFLVDHGSQCSAILGDVRPGPNDANATGSCLMTLSHDSQADLHLRQGLGSSEIGWDVLCKALSGSEADLELSGACYKTESSDAMIVARYGGEVRITGRSNGDPNDPNTLEDPNTWADLILPEPNTQYYFEASEGASVLSADSVERGRVWNHVKFNGVWNAVPRVINGSGFQPGFNEDKDCYISR